MVSFHHANLNKQVNLKAIKARKLLKRNIKMVGCEGIEPATN